MDRHTERQTHAKKKKNRLKHKQMGRNKDGQITRWTDRQKNREKDRQAERNRKGTKQKKIVRQNDEQAGKKR